MSSYGLEFPASTHIKDGMFSTLEKLKLYERNLITPGVLTAQMLSDAYDAMSQQIGQPETYFASPRVLEALRKRVK